MMQNFDSGNGLDLRYLIAEPEVSEEQLEQKPANKNQVGKLIGLGGFGMAFVIENPLNNNRERLLETHSIHSYIQGPSADAPDF